MLLPEPLRELDLMTQRAYHRTNIELELSKNKSVLCRPSPGLSRFRANGSHPAVAADRCAQEIGEILTVCGSTQQRLSFAVGHQDALRRRIVLW
jgi:hypothetical protein